MTNNELKAAVADKLADSGVWINKHLAMRVICQKVAEHSGIERGSGETMYGYLTRYAGVRLRAPGKVSAFKPLRIAAHPRAAEIDRAQPPMMTPDGVGNGAERAHGFGRGM